MHGSMNRLDNAKFFARKNNELEVEIGRREQYETELLLARGGRGGCLTRKERVLGHDEPRDPHAD